MKFTIFYILCIGWVTSGFTQEDTSKGEWSVSTFFGIAKMEVEDSFKANAFVVGGSLSKQFLLSETFSLIINLENLRISADINNSLGQNVFIQNNFLQLPIGLRLESKFNNSTSLYAEVGSNVGYLYNNNIEITETDFDDSTNVNGFNFGIYSNIMFQYQLNTKAAIKLGLRTQGDLFQNYDESDNEIRVSDLYAFNFGIGFSL